MRKTMEWLAAALAEEQSAMLVTVTETEGATPRKAGAMMAVLEDGSIDGTIGGGSVEFEALELCRELLRQRRNKLRTFRYVQGDGDAADGTVTLHFQYLDGGALSTIQQMTKWAADSSGVWLLRKFEGARVTETAVAALGDRDPEMLQERAVWKDGWLSVMVERPGRLYIFGGHVAGCLSIAAARAGFRVVVYESRRDDVARERFPYAEQILCGSFSEVWRQVTLREHDFTVVLTSEPQTDYEVLKQILNENVQYIGCIGSARKLSACRERLLADGFRQEQWDRVHAPIGLDIGAETPEELAVAITAELIAVRRGALRW